MIRQLHVHLLPELTTPEALRGGTVVVIDVLRASTTIVQALASGARQVIPCLEVDDALRQAARFAAGDVVLGGERGGLRIENFDLGNSPSEYSPERVGSKTVVFTTTNGTKALDVCRQAERVLIGAPVNLAAVCSELSKAAHVHLVCAGTNGHVTREDALAAGAITYHLTRDEDRAPLIDDTAHLARAAWRSVVAGAVAHGEPLKTRLARELQETAGGRNLLAIGHERDLELAADLNRLDVVPQLDLDQWRIHLP